MSFPERVRVGCGDGRVPDRGGVGRRRPRRVDLGPLQPHPGQRRERRHRRPRLRALLPLGGGPRGDELARPPGVPLLDLVAPHPARRPRPREPEGRSTSTGGSPRDCSSAGSRRSRPSTTGTSRRRSRTGAAGPSRDVVDRFEVYAELVYEGLGDLVQEWVTHNEPWVTAFLGYGYGTKAPGIRDWPAALASAHHVLLSHGKAVTAFRDGHRTGRIGITLDLTQVYGDAEAALRLDGNRNRWFLDPVLRGGYPADMVDLYEERVRPARVRPAGRPRADRRADRLPRRQLLPAGCRAAQRGRRAGRRRRRCRRTGRPPRWGGGSCRPR